MLQNFYEGWTLDPYTALRNDTKLSFDRLLDKAGYLRSILLLGQEKNQFAKGDNITNNAQGVGQV